MTGTVQSHDVESGRPVGAGLASVRPADVVTTAVVTVQDATRSYDLGEQRVDALRGVTFTVDPGEFVSIVGPSGSGKSTLLHLLGALDRPSTGTVRFSGRDVASLSDAELAALRNREIGFVFQQFQLLARTRALENVALPLVYAGVGRGERKERAAVALEAVGLGHRLDHKPQQLSGGEQQRVAIARALVTGPRLLLADEPTGNLDSATGADVMALLRDLNATEGVALIVITHDPDVAAQAPRQIRLRDGLVEPSSGHVASTAGVHRPRNVEVARQSGRTAPTAGVDGPLDAEPDGSAGGPP